MTIKTDIPNRKDAVSLIPYGGKKNLRAVQCIQTGEVFATTGDAAIAKGLGRTAIYLSAKRDAEGAKKYKGKRGREKLHWRWIDKD